MAGRRNDVTGLPTATYLPIATAAHNDVAEFRTSPVWVSGQGAPVRTGCYVGKWWQLLLTISPLPHVCAYKVIDYGLVGYATANGLGAQASKVIRIH